MEKSKINNISFNIQRAQKLSKVCNTKLFNNFFNKNSKTINLKPKRGDVGLVRYLPSYSKEWRNIIYSFDKNNIKNLPINSKYINLILQSYFNMFFNKLNLSVKGFGRRNTSWNWRKKRKNVRKIFLSDAEIKHTNNKVKITLYIINREKKILKNKYTKLYKKISNNLFKRSIYVYKNHVNNLYSYLEKKYRIRNEYFLEAFAENFKINKKNYVKHKLNYINHFIKLNNLLVKKYEVL